MSAELSVDRAVHTRSDAAPEAPRGRSTGWWGMTLFIATEATTFGAALASYFYLRFSHDEPWPPPGDRPPDLVLPSIATGLLVLSCAAMPLARRLALRDRTRSVAGVVALAGLAGAAFLVLQVLDWVSEWPSSTLHKDAYGSLLYCLTGLHAAHVLVGVGMLVFLVASALVGRLGRDHWEPIAIVALYWYFMAVVAVAVFLTVYLTPHL